MVKSGQNVDKSPLLLSSLIEEVISEKRYQLASQLDINLQFSINEKNYGLFALGVSCDLKRIVSNLINNSADAIYGSGKVLVSLGTVGGYHIINVSDDGCGIPPDVVPHLGYEGISYGKAKGGDSGTGLGLFHARTTIQAWGGEFKIRSTEGKGTTVILSLPATKPPLWFTDEISFPINGTVLVADDDFSIHEYWKEKFKAASSHVRLVHAFTVRRLSCMLHRSRLMLG